MTNPSNAGPEEADATPQKNGSPSPDAPNTKASPSSLSIWDRLKEHKVMQWTLAYAAAAYTLLHGTEMLSDAQEWPHFIVRLVSLLLVLSVPVVMVLAWYHGAKGLKRVSGPELMIITLLLAVGGTVLWALTRTSGEHAAAAVSATFAAAPISTTAAAPAAPRTAIAVMPFANLTGDASKDYLGDGMAEEVINTLTMVPGLKVPARTSSFAYKGRNTDIRQIAKDLGVGTILEGSVRSAGTDIRVTAQLINAQDGLHIWSQTYDRKFAGLFKLQDDLAKAIVQALQVTLNSAQVASVTQAPPTQDVEAYDLYLQGMSLNERPTIQNEERAQEYFRQAIARDPKFARAYVGVAETYVRLADQLGERPVENFTLADQVAKQALALDPSNARALTVEAGVNAWRGHLIEGQRDLDAALSLAGNDAVLHMVRSLFKGSAGHRHEMIEESRKAYALAPANSVILAMLAYAYAIDGEDAEAIKYANISVEQGFPKIISPLPVVFALTAARSGHYAEAAQAVANSSDPTDAELARTAEIYKLVYAARADPTQRAAALAARTRLYPELSGANPGSKPKSTILPCLLSSLAYAQLGAIDEAYELGDWCLDQPALPNALRFWGTRSLQLWSSEMRSFRKDPRFGAFATRLGDFMAYWQKYGPPDDCDLKDGKLTCH